MSQMKSISIPHSKWHSKILFSNQFCSLYDMYTILNSIVIDFRDSTYITKHTNSKSIEIPSGMPKCTWKVGLEVAHFKVTIHWRNFVTIYSLEENFNFWNCRPDKVQRGDANRAPLCDNRKKNWIRKEKKKKVKFALEVLATTFICFDRDFY